MAGEEEALERRQLVEPGDGGIDVGLKFLIDLIEAEVHLAVVLYDLVGRLIRFQVLKLVGAAHRAAENEVGI